MARVKLEDVCERGSSNLKQSDVVDKDGDYPIYGASGYIGNVDFYHQEQPYVAVVKDGAGIGRTYITSCKVFSNRNNAVFTSERQCATRVSMLCCEIYAFGEVFYRCNNSTYLF